MCFTVHCVAGLKVDGMDAFGVSTMYIIQNHSAKLSGRPLREGVGIGGGRKGHRRV